MISDAELAEWRRLREAATGGEWAVVLSRDVFAAVIVPGKAVIAHDFENEADAEFVVLAANNFPRLLAEIDRLRGEIHRLRSGMDVQTGGQV